MDRVQYVLEINLFEKQLGINCTREQIRLLVISTSGCRMQKHMAQKEGRLKNMCLREETIQNITLLTAFTVVQKFYQNFLYSVPEVLDI